MLLLTAFTSACADDGAAAPDVPLPKAIGKAGDAVAKKTPPVEQPIQHGLTTAQIKQLVADLGSNTFKVRSAASSKLREIGEDAIAPLAAAIATGDTEVRLRAFNSLESYFTGNSNRTINATWPVLEELRAGSNKKIAERSRSLLTRHGKRREHLLFNQLIRLNGIIQEQEQGRVIVAIDSEWEGGDAGLRWLKLLGEPGMPTGCNVYLIEGAPVSAKQFAKLETHLVGRQVMVQTRGKASLGISGAVFFRVQEGCVVSKVLPGSASDDARIRANDVITKFGGNQVDDFQHLVDLIGQYDVGEKVKTELLGKEPVFVTLKSWRATMVDPESMRKITPVVPAN